MFLVNGKVVIVFWIVFPLTVAVKGDAEAMPIEEGIVLPLTVETTGDADNFPKDESDARTLTEPVPTAELLTVEPIAVAVPIDWPKTGTTGTFINAKTSFCFKGFVWLESCGMVIILLDVLSTTAITFSVFTDSLFETSVWLDLGIELSISLNFFYAPNNVFFFLQRK